MTSLVKRLDREKLIGTAIHHVDIGKAWPNHVEQMLVEAGITRKDIELRLKERAVVISWVSMVGALLSLAPGMFFFGTNHPYLVQIIGATTSLWLYTAVLVVLRSRRISIRPYRLSAAGVIFMVTASGILQTLLSGLPVMSPNVATYVAYTGLVALFIQYQTFA